MNAWWRRTSAQGREREKELEERHVGQVGERLKERRVLDVHDGNGQQQQRTERGRKGMKLTT
jgi:hypothetical protein